MISLRCPICKHPMGRADGSAYVELRCHYRKCAGNPVVTFKIADGIALAYQMVDRRERRTVS